jgi:hypothetical protein
MRRWHISMLKFQSSVYKDKEKEKLSLNL